MTNREIDALVAEKVMGFKKVCYEPGNEGHLCTFDNNVTAEIKPYSTDIAAAFEVLKKFEAYDLRKWPKIQDGGFHCMILDNESYVEGHGETMPEAICLAALKARGGFC